MKPQAGAAGTTPSIQDTNLDRQTLEAVLDWMFAHDPPVQGMAIGETGLTVPMPPSVPLAASNRVEGVGSALELCLPTDMVEIVEAWERARRRGGAQVTVHLRVDPELPVVLHFLDARHRYGVFLGFFLGSAGPVCGAGSEPVLFRPRLCRIYRSELGIIYNVDDAFSRILGWTREELVGTRSLDLLHPEDRPLAIASWMQMLARAGSHPSLVSRFLHRDGSFVWFETTHENRLDDPADRDVVTQMVDVSDRMEAVEALRANERLLRRLTEALPIGVLQIDIEGRIVHANERLGAILGSPGAATVDARFVNVDTAGREALDAALRTVFATETAVDLELTLALPDGHRRCSVALRTLTSDRGTVTGVLACVADITEGVRLRHELEMRATFDDLTGCYNRSAIIEALTSVLGAGERLRTGIAVFFVDLDRFKETNDRLGHAAGDELLRTVGGRLLQRARAGDMVGRFGGDEFLIIAFDVPTPQAALEVARRTSATIAEHTIVAGHAIVPHASIGVAWTNLPAEADTLVARADAAMYEAKRRGSGPVLHGLKASA